MARFIPTPVLSILAALSCLVSCEREIVEQADNSIDYSIVASFQESKTVNDGMSTDWATGDAMTVFYPNAGSLTAAKFDYAGDDAFTGRINLPEAGDWYAVYPYSESINSASSVSISMPATISQSGNNSTAHLAGDGFPLVGKAAGVSNGTPTLAMEQVAAVAKFIVTNAESTPITITSIEFTAPAQIAGKFSADLTASEPAWSPVTGQASSTVKLSIAGGQEIAAGASASFYMGMMPFDQTGNFTIKLSATGNGKSLECIKELEGRHMAFPASTITKLTLSFKDNTPAAPFVKHYELVTEAPESWDGEYLIVNSSSNGSAKAWNALNANGSTVNVTVTDGSVLWSEDIEKYDISIKYFNQKYPSDNTPVYTLQNSNGMYVFMASSQMRVNSTNVNGNYTYGHVLTMHSNGVLVRCAQMQTTSSYYYLNYSSSKYQYTKVSSVPSYRVFLYKLIEGPQKQNQTLSFQESSVAWQVGDGESHQLGQVYSMPQTVSGAQTAVTYTSSDTSVAEIAGNSTIRLKGVGSTTITASAAENDSYNAAEASYTLIVTDGSVTFNNYLGNFNLVNADVDSYLQAADLAYTDSNWSTTTIMGNYPHSGGHDRPNPVVIPVSGYNNSTVTVSVYKDAALSQLENYMTTTVSNSKVEFYNLIPGKTYYYTVSASGNVVDNGTFTTTGRRRFIKVSDSISQDHANNVRDLGGLKTTDHGTLKFDKVFRGSNMDKTTTAEQQIITGYMNVRRDVDLRLKKAGETASNHSTNNAWQPLDKNLVAYTNYGWDDFSKLTNDMIKNIFTDIITTVTSDNGAVYFHCYIGADRTGYVALMLEAVLGVSEKDTSIDYELTSFSCSGLRYRDKSQQNWHYFEGLEKIEGYRGSSFQEKATNILLDAGIKQTQIDALRAAMIDY